MTMTVEGRPAGSLQDRDHKRVGAVPDGGELWPPGTSLGSVSWKPDFSHHKPDPRLAQYEGRVARICRAQEEVGALLVRLDAWCTKTSGHLWWRRWSRAQDTLELWMYLDGSFTDDYVTAEHVEQELADWQAGRFRYCGEVLHLVWTPPDEPAHLRRTQFEDDR